MQLTPFPLYPESHVQVNDPSVLLQVACASQLWTLAAHSSLSMAMKNKQQGITITVKFVDTSKNVNVELTQLQFLRSDILSANQTDQNGIVKAKILSQRFDNKHIIRYLV